MTSPYVVVTPPIPGKNAPRARRSGFPYSLVRSLERVAAKQTERQRAPRITSTNLNELTE